MDGSEITLIIFFSDAKKREQVYIRPKFRTVTLKKTKNEMENKMDASWEDELVLLLLLRRRRKRRSLHSALKRASSRFCLRNIFKKCEEFGEYHRLVQGFRNEDRKYFFRQNK